jgi:hypothetical protein
MGISQSKNDMARHLEVIFEASSTDCLVFFQTISLLIFKTMHWKAFNIFFSLDQI